MTRRSAKELVHAGDYVAEVPVELIEDSTEWSPYLSAEDARKLDIVRVALEANDLSAASKYARVFKLVPIAWPEPTSPSANYGLFREAVLRQKQVTCMYKGFYRELCPVVIGHSDGAERVLAYQFGGDSQRGLPPQGEWSCLDLSEVLRPELRDGRWHESAGHAATQTCVKDIDVDVNVDVRKPRVPAK